MASAKPRVLLCETAPRVTGSVRSLAGAVQELRSEFDFVLAAPAKEVADVVGVPWERFDFATPKKREALGYGPRVAAQGLAFGRLVRRVGAQLVHVNDLSNLVPIAARWMGSRFPLSYHVRLLPTSYLGPIYRPLAWLVLKNADRIICVSRAVLDAFPASSRVALVHNGLPLRVVHDGVPVPPELAEPRRAAGVRRIGRLVGSSQPAFGQRVDGDTGCVGVRREARISASPHSGLGDTGV